VVQIARVYDLIGTLAMHVTADASGMRAHAACANSDDPKRFAGDDFIFQNRNIVAKNQEFQHPFAPH